MRLLTHSVLVQIIIGALIKAFFPYASTVETVLTFTSLSVIGLFLMVGLQIHFKKFASELGLCAKLVFITTVIPMLLFVAIAYAFNLDTFTSLTLSVVLVTTGTGVTIQTLSNLGMLHSKAGQFLVLVSALDDVPAAIFMVILMMNSPVKTDSGSIAWQFLAISVLAFVLCNLVKNKWVMSILFLAFAISFSKFLEGFHISTVMGGLLSGFILNLVLKGKVAHSEGPIQKILNPILPFYMIYIGMKLSPGILTDPRILAMTLALTVAAVISKWVCTYLIMKKHTRLSPMVISWGMVPRGIPGFAFASLAVTSGLITKEIFTMLIMIVSVSTWIGLFGLEVSLRKLSKAASVT
jgi:Kef-type K+ transport system membrane component KefB